VLAGEAGTGRRSFARRSVEATGRPPARAIERLRATAARRPLSTSRSPANRIAQRCGPGLEPTMRRSVLRLLAVTPQDRRARSGRRMAGERIVERSVGRPMPPAFPAAGEQDPAAAPRLIPPSAERPPFPNSRAAAT